MTRSVKVLVAAAALAALSVLLSSCASGPVQIPEGLSVAELFQRAQDAGDSGNYPLAIRYYDLVAQNYPADLMHVTWASYEVAFLYHKMGKDKEALSRFNALLDQYAAQGDKLPPAPRVLAAKIKARLEEILKITS